MKELLEKTGELLAACQDEFIRQFQDCIDNESFELMMGVTEAESHQDSMKWYLGTNLYNLGKMANNLMEVIALLEETIQKGE